MKKLLNTLYITNEQAFLSLENETVCVEVERKKIGQFPLHTLESIVTFSYLGASTGLISKCVEKGINFAFYNAYGKFLFRATGKSQGNVLLRKQQYRLSDNLSDSCMVARNFILGKVYNSRWSIDRSLRDHSLRINEQMCRNVVACLNNNLKKFQSIDSMDSLRGLEGECASLYFSVFDEMILNQKEDFFFKKRSKRPPLDNVNTMLSFGYSLLANDCTSALEGVGLDSYVGFLHRDRPGRNSLALDLMEELRAIFVDRFVLTLINNKQLKAENFKKTDSGAIIFTTDGKRKFLTEWQNRKREEIIHPFLKEKISWGLVPHVQALLLARFIRGDLDAYPPFLWK